MNTKTVHLIIRDNCFIAVYKKKNGFQDIRGNYELTGRGDYKASFYRQFIDVGATEDMVLNDHDPIYSKTMTGLKQKIRYVIRKTYYNYIVN